MAITMTPRDEFVKNVIVSALQLDENNLSNIAFAEYADGFVFSQSPYLKADENSEESVIIGLFIDDNFVMLPRTETYNVLTVLSKAFRVNVRNKMIEKYGEDEYNNIKFNFYFLIYYKNTENVVGSVYYSNIINIP